MDELCVNELRKGGSACLICSACGHHSARTHPSNALSVRGAGGCASASQLGKVRLICQGLDDQVQREGQYRGRGIAGRRRAAVVGDAGGKPANTAEEAAVTSAQGHVRVWRARHKYKEYLTRYVRADMSTGTANRPTANESRNP
eukprot:7193559-Prymnesium_polylepis.1